MNSLTIRLLVAVVPLVLLVATFTLSEITQKHHAKRITRNGHKSTQGAAPGPNDAG